MTSEDLRRGIERHRQIHGLLKAAIHHHQISPLAVDQVRDHGTRLGRQLRYRPGRSIGLRARRKLLACVTDAFDAGADKDGGKVFSSALTSLLDRRLTCDCPGDRSAPSWKFPGGVFRRSPIGEVLDRFGPIRQIAIDLETQVSDGGNRIRIVGHRQGEGPKRSARQRPPRQSLPNCRTTGHAAGRRDRIMIERKRQLGHFVQQTVRRIRR